MHFRPLRSLAALTLAVGFSLAFAPSVGAAGDKDKEAQKLLDAAMNDDYLATEFAKAEKKLKDALAKCGSSGCSAEMVGKIHIAMGTVQGVGLSKMDQAKESFVAALKADGKAALDTSLTTPELTKAFDEAKKIAGKGGGEGDKPKKPSSGNAAGHTPPAEQVVNTPVPIYFEPPEDQAVAKATLRYKPFGGTKYKSVEMKKMGKGFGGEIPCEDVTTTGDIKYYFVLTDESGDPAGTVGSANEPYKVPLKNEIEAEAPRLPGKKPPDVCKGGGGDCPPGFPCEKDKRSSEKRGDKGWGASCEATNECKEGFSCLNGSCEEGKDDGTKDKAAGKGKRNLISLTASLDALIVGSAQQVCSPPSQGETSNHACFIAGTKHQFFGNPIETGTTNGIQGGFGVAGARFTVAYDRQILQNLGLTLGARIGFAVGGSPTPDNTQPNGSAIALAKSFLPIHVEARASWYFGGGLLEYRKFRPYVFVGGGLAQVNSSVPVDVCDANVDASFDKNGKSACHNVGKTSFGQPRHVDAYQITGLNFIGFGGGSTFAITQNFGVMAELRMMIMLPTIGFVFNPTIGPVVGF